MSDPLLTASKIAASGMFAQSARMRVVSENMANANSTGSTPGADAYRRKTISFENAYDEALSADTVAVKAVGRDESPFRIEHRPGDPAADADGNVKLPNVNMLMEIADMREAVRGYTANTQIIKQVREMTSMTIDLLRS